MDLINKLICMIIVLLAIGTSYGKNNQDIHDFLANHVEQQVQTQVKDFINSATGHGIQLNLTNFYVVFDYAFKEPTFIKTTAGLCDFNQKIVYINPYYWTSKDTSDASKQNLIDHELGHCLLGREHTNSLVRVGGDYPYIIQRSVMATGKLNDAAYIKHKRWYRDELFQPDELFNIFSSTTQKIHL